MARTERQAKASRVTGTPAGRWQRVVMGLAAFVLLGEGVFAFWTMTELLSGAGTEEPYFARLWFFLAWILIFSGSFFGFLAARPPHGVLRRIFVLAAILAPFAIPYLYYSLLVIYIF